MANEFLVPLGIPKVRVFSTYADALTVGAQFPGQIFVTQDGHLFIPRQYAVGSVSDPLSMPVSIVDGDAINPSSIGATTPGTAAFTYLRCLGASYSTFQIVDTAYHDNNMYLQNAGLAVSGLGTVTVSGSTYTRNSHGYSNGTLVQITSTGSLPTGQPTYPCYVVNVAANTFQLSKTVGGTAITLSSSGSGTLSSASITMGYTAIQFCRDNDNFPVGGATIGINRGGYADYANRFTITANLASTDTPSGIPDILLLADVGGGVLHRRILCDNTNHAVRIYGWDNSTSAYSGIQVDAKGTLRTGLLTSSAGTITSGGLALEQSDGTVGGFLGQTSGSGSIYLKLPAGTDGSNGLLVYNGAGTGLLLELTDAGNLKIANDGGAKTAGIRFNRFSGGSQSWLGAIGDAGVYWLIDGAGLFWFNNAGNTQLLKLDNTGVLTMTDRVQLAPFAKATLPAASTAGGLIYVTDNTAQPCPAYADGTNWRSVITGLVIA